VGLILRGGPGPGGGCTRPRHHEAGVVRATVHRRRQSPSTSQRLRDPDHRDDIVGSPGRRGRVLHDQGGGGSCRIRCPDAQHAHVGAHGGGGVHAHLRRHHHGGNNALPTERIAFVRVPTLVIDGGASPAWMHHAAQAVADALPDAQRRTLPGQTHGVAAEAIAPALEEFFAD
jgi:hypothetical protein